MIHSSTASPIHTARATGRTTFSHPHGTHDDRFWALTLTAYAAEHTPQPTHSPHHITPIQAITGLYNG